VDEVGVNIQKADRKDFLQSMFANDPKLLCAVKISMPKVFK